MEKWTERERRKARVIERGQREGKGNIGNDRKTASE
jgi:hypothetical protein